MLRSRERPVPVSVAQTNIKGEVEFCGMFKVQIKVNRRISSYLPHTSSPSKLKNPPAPATRPALSPLVLVSVPAT